MTDECKHTWELQSTQYQFPIGIGGTSTAVEYAYLLCQKCGSVKKTPVVSDIQSLLKEK